MHRQGLFRAPIVAALAALSFFVVPAAAEAHHVESQAECVLVDNQPTLRLTAQFVNFSSTKDVSGKVWVDGVNRFDGKPDITWTGDDGTWVWTQPATAGATYTVKTEWSWPPSASDGEEHKTSACPAPPPPPPTVGIDVEKSAVESTAVAGSTVNFTMSVTNTGNTSFASYVFDDPRCDEQRTGSNAGDTTLDPGETWTYACSMATQAGQTSADNTATATGTNSQGMSATDDDSASIPLTQPQQPGVPPQGGTSPQGGTPPSSGGVLPETVLSGRARLSGPRQCVERTFRARVRGRSIARVRFFVDGELVKTVRGTRAVYKVRVSPRNFGYGRHRVVARVRFVEGSGTPARTLSLTFRRCRQQVVQPRFTG
jgi:hypothetical protein